MYREFTTVAGEQRYEYRNDSGLHRKDAPAVIIRSTKTGIVIREEYWFNGVRHRLGAPAIIQRCPNTSRITFEDYIEDGKLTKRVVKGYPRKYIHKERDKHAQQRAFILH